MSRISLRLLLALACSMPAAATRAQAVVSLSDPAADASFQLAPGVIVAPGLGCVYARAPGGAGIETLDARTLRPRAHTLAASVPLLVTEGQLLALAPGNKLQLVWLDARTLRRNHASAALEVPDWLAAGLRETAADSSSWSADVSDAIYVRYVGSSRHVGVAAPAPRGTIRVDPQTGAAELVERAPVPAMALSFPLVEPIRAGPFFVAGLSVVVSVLGGEPKRVRIERRRLSDGARLPALTHALPAGKGLLSLDRGALWIAEPAGDGSVSGARLIGTRDGRELVHLPFDRVPQAFLSSGKRVWYVTEEGLGTLELGSGVRVTPRALFGADAAGASVAAAASR